MRAAGVGAASELLVAGVVEAGPTVEAHVGLEGDVDSITHRELQERRRNIQEKLEAEGLPSI